LIWVGCLRLHKIIIHNIEQTLARPVLELLLLILMLTGAIPTAGRLRHHIRGLWFVAH